MIRTLTMWLATSLFFLGASNTWASNDQQQAAINLLTSSYMMRFYSYLGDEKSNLSVSMKPENELASGEQAIAILSENENAAKILSTWQSFKNSIGSLDNAWLVSEMPSHHVVEDMKMAHIELVSQLALVAGEQQSYKDTFELLSMMEYYMHQSTPVGYISTASREYGDLGVEVERFESRMSALEAENKLDRMAVVRWKYIKPAMQSNDFFNAPMVMLRHGGSLAKAISKT